MLNITNQTIEFLKKHSIEDKINLDQITGLLRSIVEENEEGLLNLSDMGEYTTGTLSLLDELMGDYPEEAESLQFEKTMVQDMITYCEGKGSIAMAVISLLKEKTHFSEKDYSNAENGLAELLKIYPYDRESEERKFFSSEVFSHSLYSAYLIENESVPSEEQSFLLDEMLKNAVYERCIFSFNERTVLKGHLGVEGCTISSITLLKLMEERRIGLEYPAQMALIAIKDSGADAPISFAKYINRKFLASRMYGITFGTLKDIFESVFYVSKSKSWIKSFARNVAALSNGDVLADEMIEFLKIYSPEDVSRFRNDYLKFRNKPQGEMQPKLKLAPKKNS